MKNYFVTVMLLVFFAASFAFSQVPADQDTIVIPGGVENMGSIETTINGDTLNGARINPDRIYKLEKNTMYFIQSRIQFGGGNDTTATLNIVGEKGGNLPVILTSPKEGQGAPVHLIHGSLIVEHVYWPATTIDNQSRSLFELANNKSDLRLEGVVTEGMQGGPAVRTSNVTDAMDIFIKDCYFRDNSQFVNSWNYGIISRGTSALPIDTLWVENTTVSNAGMPFYGKLVPVNFMYFNHNSFINTPKYPIWYEDTKEAYITNNLFINCNYEGECYATYHSQLQSQIEDSAGHFAGIVNLMPIDEDIWETVFGYVPEQEQVKWLASNNLHYTSPLLDEYYNGGYDNDPADYPISNRDWGFLPEGMSIPTKVENVPPAFITSLTQSMIDNYDKVIEDNNYDNTIDPEMVTKSIPDETVAQVYAKKAMKDYGVLPLTETWTDEDKLVLVFGDRNPTTLPGIETEDGAGFRTVRDLLEDFSYNADVTSTIDSRHLGSLQWFPEEFGAFNSEMALENIKNYFNNSITGVKKLETVPNGYNLSQNYPNPFNPSTTINFTIPTTCSVKLAIFDLLGRKIDVLVDQELNTGKYNVIWNAGNQSSGLYFYTITTKDFTSTKKMLYVK